MRARFTTNSLEHYYKRIISSLNTLLPKYFLHGFMFYNAACMAEVKHSCRTPTPRAQMVHLFFDIRDNDVLNADPDGLDFNSIEIARDEAIKVIVDLAKDAVPLELQKNLSVEVRTAGGTVVFKAMLSLQVERFV
jgi:hypothetical protein